MLEQDTTHEPTRTSTPVTGETTKSDFDNQPVPEDIPDFIEIACKSNIAPTCVDGRNCTLEGFTEAGQMLGGSLNLIILKAINEGKVIDEALVAKVVAQMKALDIPVGGHIDNHDHEGVACGCGFADKITVILKTAKDRQQEIIDKIVTVHSADQTAYNTFFGEGIDVSNLLTDAYNPIAEYDVNTVTATGGEIVHKLDKEYKLEGDHEEKVAFVNLKQKTTLNVVALNQKGEQGFNLDLWMVKDQAGKLVGSKEANKYAMQSLILYVATEIVLVESKGNDPLPVKTIS